jgi:4-amino-4-deoxy-L-arabinose transferase-like glycosyltransferase
MAIFVIALLPRILAPDEFLTPDEPNWLGRSRDFLAGIVGQNWIDTLQTGHPGVTTMWTGSLGIMYRYWTRPAKAPTDLLTFIKQIPNTPPPVNFIAPVRMPTILLMSLFVVIYYYLTRRLTSDWRVALIAGLLVALSPFQIALSRVLHHDALATAFMTLSLLLLLGYWFQGWSSQWLVLSGIAAGLSFLSKSPSLFLIPFHAVLCLGWVGQRCRLNDWKGWFTIRKVIISFLIWGVVAGSVVFLFWPAMWVAPFETLSLVFGVGTQYAIDGHSQFLLGQTTRDPGLAYYPLILLFRVSPLLLFGLFLWVGFYLRSTSSKKQHPTIKLVSVVLLLYVLLFVMFLTVSAKKFDRYMLPIFPPLSICASLGITYLADLEIRLPRLEPVWFKHRLWFIIATVLVVQAAFVAQNHPYYFTYFNPLLGGTQQAAKLITIGWGEGLEQAAAHLNRLPDAKSLRVVSVYPHSFGAFFKGEVIDHTQILSSDYVLLYVNQIQRDFLGAHRLLYFLKHRIPEFTATINGVDYVYVYKIPMTQRGTGDPSGLLEKAFFAGISQAEVDDRLYLYWLNLGMAAEESWWTALESSDGEIFAWNRCRLRPDFANERLVIDSILESECLLFSQNLPAGTYHLRVGRGSKEANIVPVPFPEGKEFLVIQ